MQAISRFETRLNDLRAITKLRALIANLLLQVRFLDADIRDQEQRMGIFDVTDVAYPLLARNLRARRDNLLATIRVLEGQLPQKDMVA
jgi:hypothetical protein